MTEQTQYTIEIPQLDGESQRAYAARIEYITMGAGRSIDKLLARAQTENKASTTRRRATLGQWSGQFEWVKWAQKYDQEVALATVREAAQQYRANLKEHRERYHKTGRDLYAVATALMYQCNQAIRGKRIVDRDGVEHFIPAMEMTHATLNTAIRGILAAADIEAHALQIEELMPKLSDASELDE